MFFNIAGLDQHFFIQPPAYFLLMAGAYRLFGFNETVARLGSAVPYLAGILAGFFLVRSISMRIGLRGRRAMTAGLLGTVLLAFNQQSIQTARGGRPDWLAVLLLFLGWFIVDQARQAGGHRPAYLITGFAVLQLAGLTHPALAAPATGITLATIIRPSWLGISRRMALGTGLAGAGLVILPYAIWIISYFNDWRIQFLHVIISSGSGRWNSFLSTQLHNFILDFKYQPAIVILIILGLAAFPWRAAPDGIGAVVGIGVVAAGSTDPYFKFLLLIAIIPTATGILLLATNGRATYRRSTVGLAVLATLNGVLFPLARAYAIHQFYWQRDPMLVTKNIEQFVPHGAHLMGGGGVYFATLADDAEFREFQVLAGLRWSNKQDLQAQFRSAVEKYRPNWFALPPGMDPSREYCYLQVHFRRVSGVNVAVSSGFNTGGNSSVAYTLWKSYPGRSAGC